MSRSDIKQSMESIGKQYLSGEIDTSEYIKGMFELNHILRTMGGY